MSLIDDIDLVLAAIAPAPEPIEEPRLAPQAVGKALSNLGGSIQSSAMMLDSYREILEKMHRDMPRDNFADLYMQRPLMESYSDFRTDALKYSAGFEVYHPKRLFTVSGI